MKYCQGPLCHTYDTKDRKRGPKGNKVNLTPQSACVSYVLIGNTEGGISETILFAPNFQFPN